MRLSNYLSNDAIGLLQFVGIIGAVIATVTFVILGSIAISKEHSHALVQEQLEECAALDLRCGMIKVDSVMVEVERE